MKMGTVYDQATAGNEKGFQGLGHRPLSNQIQVP